MSDAIEVARSIVAERARNHPRSPFYTYALGEMARIDEAIANAAKPDREFYESLTHGIGLMCARELEPTDPDFCSAVYQMLEDIRVEVA